MLMPLTQHALGLDGGQAFIPEADFEAGTLRQALGEFAGVFGLPAFAAAHMQRMPHQD